MLYFGACFYNAAEERNMPAGYTLSRAERDAVVTDIVGVNLTCVFFLVGKSLRRAAVRPVCH